MKIAMELLKLDNNLEKSRYKLVPKYLKEEEFWKNYFYRIFLIASINDINKVNNILDENKKLELQKKKKKKKIEYDFSELETILKKAEMNSSKLRNDLIEVKNLKRNKNEISEEKLFHFKTLENIVIEDKKLISNYLIEIKDEEMFDKVKKINDKISLILKESEILKINEKKPSIEKKTQTIEKKVNEENNEIKNKIIDDKEDIEIKIITEKDQGHFGLDDELELELDLDLTNVHEITTEEKLPWEEEEKIN
jgi:hypothetical protein